MSEQPLRTKEELHATSIPISAECGVYFLFMGEELVYVGQSIKVPARIGQHAHFRMESGINTQWWDRYAVIRCRPDELHDLEAAYILRYRPKFNSTDNQVFHKVRGLALFARGRSAWAYSGPPLSGAPTRGGDRRRKAPQAV